MHRVTALLAASLLALVDSGIVGITASATAQSPGSFARTSDMTTARSQHSATLLFGGHVLLAGGSGGLATTEIYDPVAGTFRAAGTMTMARRLAHGDAAPGWPCVGCRRTQ